MRSLGTRRAVQVAGAATVAALGLAGCSAGQVAETANLKAPVAGINTSSADGGLLIRNLQVLYNGPLGYPANGSAPLQVSLYNQTEQAITVTISSKPVTDQQPGIVSAQQVGVLGGASGGDASAAPSPAPAPSDSAAPSAAPAAPSAAPAKFTIKPLDTETFLPGDPQTLQVIGLSDKLVPGYSVSLVFETSTSTQPLQVFAPVAVPMSAGSRAPGIPGENAEE